MARAVKLHRVLKAFQRFCRQRHWPCIAPGDNTLRGLTQGDNGRWDWVAFRDEHRPLLAFHCIAPVKVPRRRRHLAAEYLTRANDGMIYGGFEMDYADGEVRCKTALVLQPPGVTDEALEPLVFTNFAVMDRYLPGLLAVAYGKQSPAEAIRQAEQADEPEGESEAPVPAQDLPLMERMRPSEN